MQKNYGKPENPQNQQQKSKNQKQRKPKNFTEQRQRSKTPLRTQWTKNKSQSRSRSRSKNRPKTKNTKPLYSEVVKNRDKKPTSKPNMKRPNLKPNRNQTPNNRNKSLPSKNKNVDKERCGTENKTDSFFRCGSEQNRLPNRGTFRNQSETSNRVDPKIINLSNRKLDSDEMKVLNKGLKYTQHLQLTLIHSQWISKNFAEN
ncbi:unnamed protein product [Mytilus edulis]|uniref:Uncharacterized protein n=1 Tax=Mytilus edulis TaxID=6550 RepID=A0A8S3UYP7_MYTED|nr:unnamed protein product [Mytilus edulis]